MSHDEKTSRAFDGLMTAMRTNELHESIKILARQVAELQGVDFDTEGDQIIQDALQQGHDDYHQRVAQKSFKLIEKLGHTEKPSEEDLPPNPLYEFLKEQGTRIPAGSYEGQPDIPEGHRLFDVYDSFGSCTPFCVDVTNPKDWTDSCKNGYENWGGRLACILVSEEKLTEFKNSVGPSS